MIGMRQLVNPPQFSECFLYWYISPEEVCYVAKAVMLFQEQSFFGMWFVAPISSSPTQTEGG